MATHGNFQGSVLDLCDILTRDFDSTPRKHTYKSN